MAKRKKPTDGCIQFIHFLYLYFNPILSQKNGELIFIVDVDDRR
jgi:hypothetical protein